MEKISHFLCAISLLLLCTISAESQTSITELLERVEENHVGGITEVFTSAEIELLRAHFDAKSESILKAAPENVGVYLYAPENVNLDIGGFFNEDPSNFMIYGPSGTADFEGAGAYNPLTDMYFVVDNAGNAYDLHAMNYGYTLRGVVSAPPGESYVGLEFDPTSNTLYGLSTDGAGNTGLSTIDPISLDVSYKGNTGLTLGIALGFDLEGEAYAIDIDTDQAYKIDKYDASATLLGSIGYNANFGQGIGLSRSLGEIYITAFNNSIFNSELRTLDTKTGNTVSWGLIGDMMPGGTLQFAWNGAREMGLGRTDPAFGNFVYFPSPVKSELHLQADTEISSIQILNLLGQTVIQKNIFDLQSRISLEHLSSGYYLMRITIADSSKTFKLLKD